jgi:hypothetical protein
LREAVLWFGCLKTVRRRATVLPGPHTLVGEAEPEIDLAGPDGYLYEPSPAVMRAGLVRTLGAQIGASMLDRRIAFSSPTASSLPLSPGRTVAEAIPSIEAAAPGGTRHQATHGKNVAPDSAGGLIRISGPGRARHGRSHAGEGKPYA